MPHLKIPFFSMESYFKSALSESNESLASVDSEIRTAFTFGYDFLHKAPPHDQPGFLKTVNYLGKNPVEVYRGFSEKELEVFDSLNYSQKERFLFFSGTSFMWDWGLILTEEPEWTKRFGPKALKPEIDKYFPKLLNFIKYLPFEYTGRILIMGTSPFHRVHRHYDSFFDEPVLDCVVLRFQPEDHCGKAYVEDHKGVSHATPLRCYCLDDSFPHLVEATAHFNYSVRVEGKFKSGIRPDSHKLASTWTELPKVVPIW